MIGPVQPTDYLDQPRLSHVPAPTEWMWLNSADGPAASNDTKEGGAKNRRVELTPVR